MNNKCSKCNNENDVKSFTFFYGITSNNYEKFRRDEESLIKNPVFTSWTKILGYQTEDICDDCIIQWSKGGEKGCIGLMVLLVFIGLAFSYSLFDTDNVIGGILVIALSIGIVGLFMQTRASRYEKQSSGESIAWNLNKEKIKNIYPDANAVLSKDYFKAIGLGEENMKIRQSIMDAVEVPNVTNLNLLIGVLWEVISAENPSSDFIKRIINALAKSDDNSAIEILRNLAAGQTRPDFEKQVVARIKSAEKRAIIHGVFSKPLASSIAPMDKIDPISEIKKAEILVYMLKRLATEALVEIGELDA